MKKKLQIFKDVRDRAVTVDAIAGGYLLYQNAGKVPTHYLSDTNFRRRLIPDEGPLLEKSNLFVSLR